MTLREALTTTALLVAIALLVAVVIQPAEATADQHTIGVICPENS